MICRILSLHTSVISMHGVQLMVLTIIPTYQIWERCDVSTIDVVGSVLIYQ